MTKFKLLFWIIFLFTYQLSFSSSQNADVIEFIVGFEMDNQLQHEKIHFRQHIAGEIPNNQFKVLDHSHPTTRLLLYYHSKDLQVLVIQNNKRYPAVAQEYLFTGSTNKGLTNVPIYLQTEKFRL